MEKFQDISEYESDFIYEYDDETDEPILNSIEMLEDIPDGYKEVVLLRRKLLQQIETGELDSLDEVLEDLIDEEIK